MVGSKNIDSSTEHSSSSQNTTSRSNNRSLLTTATTATNRSYHRNRFADCYRRLGFQIPSERPMWQQLRGFGMPVGGTASHRVPIAVRRRRWLRRRPSQFELLEKFGESGNGEVWSARDKKTGQIVTIMKVNDRNEQGFPLSLLHEIMLQKSLNHENIVKFTDVVTDLQGTLMTAFLVFNDIELTLSKLRSVSTNGFTIAQCKNITRQILRGLAYCSEKGVTHGDITTSNIFIDNSSVVKLTGFGFGSTQDVYKERNRNRIFKLWYKSPEVLMGKKAYGPEVDIWSVGCIVAELLAGAPLIRGSDEAEQLDKIFKTTGSPNESVWPTWRSLPNSDMVSNDIYSPSLAARLSRVSGLTDTCIQLIESMLALDPEKRITAEEALDHSWFREQPVPCFNLQLRQISPVSSDADDGDDSQQGSASANL